MNIYADIPSPAMKQATENASLYGVNNHGLTNLHRVYWNLPTPALYEEAVFRGEGVIAHCGPFVVNTGKHTARAAADKYIVREQTTEDKVWWGQYNRPFTPEKFSALLTRLQGFLQGRDIFVQDCYAGADQDVRMPIRIITEKAWHSMFARTMFTKLRTIEEMRRHVPEFTVIAAPSFLASPIVDGTRSETFIIANFAERLAIIGGSNYGGEIKKTIFTVLNFLLPLEGVLPMHCSANVGDDGDVAIFFGLSGTGKTTLSADPQRHLIGDDEHGWSDNGIFNFENGCYAKVIRLSEEAEPQIYACTRRFGTILENVVFDPASRRLDLDDDRITENTRGVYPLEYIENYWPARRAGHPRNVIFLTCDASGVLPPIARLTPDQSIYHFISGYTSKIAGTEIGLGTEPEITFSPCFGGPFMVHHPYTYAEMLKARIVKHGATCWLVNTGWTGGPFGVGKRLSIQHTRTLLNNALSGKLNKVKFRIDPVFGFEVPEFCEGVPTNILDPANTWGSREEYYRKYDALAARFIENFKLIKDGCPPHIVEAGPKRLTHVPA
ncbi:MAG TPA: phosphoenolpyruvate carboxykinase (ATP) [Bryobacteraceae bacterium]|nr:phosphoenolpyruvate carboxykinase (ATP) [Bryobacteraceae bacterium]HOQ45753.1 phosphoenolpyruvate carboxykinase (ATP) [Bryobacteraceae bacterium]HPQ13957.1 phosphoenolpyruvate carboxykinase (ATP) [Bryobacteraceae bacterium]HPU71520.1 phosphoenolpyruvate carboxykinase (ATP) [Bryobacteraceae bacterium]